MNMDLTGKNAFVGGGSKGLGKASAMALASLGAEVTIAARDEEGLKTALAELPRPHGQIHQFVLLDYDNVDQVSSVIEQIARKKTIHILINNTGGPAGGLITEATPAAFQTTFNRHLIINHLLATHFLSGMRQAGYGRIINIISTSVKQPLPGLGVSNTIRGAVANWAKTLANELAPWGITVNNILPGATATDRLASIIEAKASKKSCPPEDIAREMTAEIPMGRFGKPEELAAAVAFIASPAASYITGINLPVDGGRTGCL